MAYNKKDSYYHKAKADGYSSRAAYKLIEINTKYNLIKRNMVVLDCGAAPGSWSEVTLNIVGKLGKVVAVDLERITHINKGNFYFVFGNMMDYSVQQEIDALVCGGVDVILSDMAPKTTGIKIQDHINSIELATLAFEMSCKYLKKNGNLIVKLFDGEYRENFVEKIRRMFFNIKIIRPEATRKNSFELYVIGMSKLD